MGILKNILSNPRQQDAFDTVEKQAWMPRYKKRVKTMWEKRHTIIKKVYTILTEEDPSENDINCILKILNIKTSSRWFFEQPDTTRFKGGWVIKLSNTTIYVRLFKGTTSCVDYIVLEGNIVVNSKLDLTNALIIMESTKTNDNVSRNTSVYQRICKFEVFKRMFPKCETRMIMYYHQKWEQKKITQTALFGFRLMKSLNIHAYHGEYEDLYTKYNITSFDSIVGMIDVIDLIKRKQGNTHLKIVEKLNHNYEISCKLDKGITGKFIGKMSHDPNVGFLSGVINFIFKKDPLCVIKIKDHHLCQEYFDKKPESKFWFAIQNIQVCFDGIVNITYPSLPKNYISSIQKTPEKYTTIHMTHMLSSDLRCIFSNHSGCALTYLETESNSNVKVGRKMHRPDVVLYNKAKKEIYIVEGKTEKSITKGLEQLSDEYLKDFIVLIKNEYPHCKIKKYLCITIDSIKNIFKYEKLPYPILFALDLYGNHYSMI